MFDPHEFDQIDWDDIEAEGSNLAHCLEHGVDEQVVDEVLREHPVEVKLSLISAEYSIVGPDTGFSTLWTLLFDHSYKRGDWLRPVTGWRSKPNEIEAWQKGSHREWKGKR